jgi:predicted HTH domain antitoxin
MRDGQYNQVIHGVRRTLEDQVAKVEKLVRRGKITKGKASELLGISLWELPDLIARYRIPWFTYRPEELEKDLEILHKFKLREENTP